MYTANCCTVTDYFSGLTNSNYTELAQLYEKYKDQGVSLIYCFCVFFVLCYLSVLVAIWTMIYFVQLLVVHRIKQFSVVGGAVQ